MPRKEVDKSVYDFTRWLTQLSLDTGVVVKEVSLVDVKTGKSLGTLVYDDATREYVQAENK